MSNDKIRGNITPANFKDSLENSLLKIGQLVDALHQEYKQIIDIPDVLMNTFAHISFTIEIATVPNTTKEEIIYALLDSNQTKKNLEYINKLLRVRLYTIKTLKGVYDECDVALQYTDTNLSPIIRDYKARIAKMMTDIAELKSTDHDLCLIIIQDLFVKIFNRYVLDIPEARREKLGIKNFIEDAMDIVYKIRDTIIDINKIK